MLAGLRDELASAMADLEHVLYVGDEAQIVDARARVQRLRDERIAALTSGNPPQFEAREFAGATALAFARPPEIIEVNEATGEVRLYWEPTMRGNSLETKPSNGVN